MRGIFFLTDGAGLVIMVVEGGDILNDMELMREAILEADLAFSEGEIPVGCVIAKDGEIIARAHNLRAQSNDPTAHAEIIAIRRAAAALGDWRLTDCTLYVTLEPCPMCAGAISQSRVGRLVYGAEDSAYGCAGSLYRIPEDPAFPHFCPSHGGLLRAECREKLENFFEKKRLRDSGRDSVPAPCQGE